MQVSVIIAARNESQYVADAVESIMAQTGVEFELIFVEDHSTDDTHEIVARIAESHTNLRLVLNPGRGKVQAFNHGVSLAKGEWVCLFAGDDLMPAKSLAARWDAVRSTKAERPVVGLSRLITMSEFRTQDGVVVPKNPNRGGFTGTSYLMGRGAVAKLFPVPETLPNEDTWLETGILHFDFELVHCGVIGNKWRVHAGNSVNMMVPFDQFNSKITSRMIAYSLFLERHGDELSAQSRRALVAKIECEEGRKSGDILRIMRSGASVVERLRAVSMSSAGMYEIRRRLYGLLSGW